MDETEPVPQIASTIHLNTIQINIDLIRERIRIACLRVDRDPNTITLIAATKTQPPDRIVEAYQAGIRHFGENYVQEALSKVGQPPLDWPDACWHLIGHLQSNKARDIIPKDGARFALIQTVDSLSLARTLAHRARLSGLIAAILLEVKLDPGPAKFGFAPESVLEDVVRIQEMDGIVLHGLMGMAPFSSYPEMARPYFRQLRNLYLLLPKASQQVLSMGMTGDFEVAIEEGATHVRIGTAIFGPR